MTSIISYLDPRLWSVFLCHRQAFKYLDIFLQRVLLAVLGSELISGTQLFLCVWHLLAGLACWLDLLHSPLLIFITHFSAMPPQNHTDHSCDCSQSTSCHEGNRKIPRNVVKWFSLSGQLLWRLPSVSWPPTVNSVFTTTMPFDTVLI